MDKQIHFAVLAALKLFYSFLQAKKPQSDGEIQSAKVKSRAPIDNGERMKGSV
ncbi:MAG: hypothetical protein ABF651_07560 [Sporolactobacillus sp.]